MALPSIQTHSRGRLCYVHSLIGSEHGHANGSVAMPPMQTHSLERLCYSYCFCIFSSMVGSGMKMAMTIKPTTTPRMMTIKGSIMLTMAATRLFTSSS